LKKDLKLALFFGICGLVGGIAVVPYQIDALKSTTPGILETMPPLAIVMLAGGIQSALLSFVLSFIGIKLARQGGLSFEFFETLLERKKPIWSKKALITSVLFGAIIAVVIVFSDIVVFQFFIPELAGFASGPSLFALIAGVLYGGIVEEVLMRLFLMSFVVWIVMKLSKSKLENSPPPWIYYSAILITAFLFALGHLPFTNTLFGRLDAPILLRGIILNSIGGIGFGYLFWKFDLVYAILAHMLAHVFMQFMLFF